MIDWATSQLSTPLVTPLLVAVLGISVAALSLWALVVARRSLQPASGELDASGGLELVYLEPCRGETSKAIEAAMRKGRSEMRRSRLETAPWYMMMGESGAGKTTFLAESGLPHPFGGPADRGAGGPLDLWLFDETAVLDPKGELILRSDGRSHDAAGWMCLLRQVEKARPRRPLDGLVVTIPATRLVSGTATERDQAALEADASLRANALYQRLAELQQILGMRLPVYVVITQSDHLEGWSAFVASQPLETRRQMFGWSSPYAPTAPYQASWVGEAFSTFDDRLQEAQAAALGSGRRPGARAAAFLDFPEQVARLEPATRIYLNHLFSHSAFLEGFMMRGLFLTGGAFDGVLEAANRDVEGLCPPPPSPPTGSRRQRVPDSILYAHDLLQQKVFPENSVGTATEEAKKRATFEQRLAQVTALALPILALLGMFFDHQWISRDAGQLAPLVRQVNAQLEGPGPSSEEQRVSGAGDLVDGAAEVDRYSFRGLFLPPSWLSPLYGRVRGTFQGGYDEVVFPGLRSQLGTWQKHLAAPWPPPDPGPHIAYVEETPEFEQLQTFSQQLTRFDDDVYLYDCLVVHCTSGSGALTAFDQLTRDLLGLPFKVPTGHARRFYASRLERIDAEAFSVGLAGREALQAQARRLSGQLDGRQFTDNSVLEDLKVLRGEIVRLELDSNVTAADYRLLDELIQHLAQELQRPEIAWMGKPDLEPGPVVRQTYDALAASPYVGEATVKNLEMESDDDFETLRRELRDISTPSTGHLLARADDGYAKLELSKGVLDLDKAIQGLLGESFMAEESHRKLRPPAEQERLFWTQGGLKKTTDLVTAFQSFAEGGASPFPEDLQGTTLEVALDTLAEHMLDSLAASQSFRPAPPRVSTQTLERGLAMQVRNVTTTGATLAQILDDFLALQLFDASDQLTAVLTAQQTHMLEDLDALLALEPLFQPVDETFAWWNGVEPPAPAAFGLEPPRRCPPPPEGWCAAKKGTGKSSSSSSSSASSSSSSPGSSGSSSSSGPSASCGASATTKGAVTQWVAGETASATHLVKAYATPILGSPFALHLLPDSKLDALTARWQGITTDVDQAQKKQPGSPLLVLEQFITTTMMELSLGTCFDDLPSPPPAPGGDYFGDRYSELTRGLDGRCRVLASQEGLGGYRRYAQIFDQRLASRRPFAVADAATPIGAEATPAALRDFYTSFDHNACLVADVPTGDPAFSGQEDEVRAFVAQMAEVRDFFALFLDQPKKYPRPTYGFRVEFRVNRDREAFADQVIDWRLDVADQALVMGLPTSPPPPPPPSKPSTTAGAAPTATTGTALGGSWVFGQPSILSLRWADESPARPVTPPVSDRVRLRGRTVIWDYENLWSLLSLVRDFPATAADFTGLEDPQGETLKLAIGTRPASDSGSGSSDKATENAVAFVRVTFLTPDYSTELAVPPFPTRAPRLTEPGFTVAVDGLQASFKNETRGRYESLRWSFGDGAESRQENPTHRYPEAGTFDATLEVTESGVTERVTKPVDAGAGAPVASFTFEVTGRKVSFTDTSTHSPVAWSWDFGDGSSDVSQDPVHEYAAGGDFTVTLEASNEHGSGHASRTVTVAGTPAPEALFTAMPEGGNFVRFLDESKGEITSYHWDFGDGETSTEKDPGHLYSSGGDYTVTLKIEGPGGKAEAEGQVTVR